MLTFTPTGDGDASSGISAPLFFIPQPEPPPQFADDFGFQFAFNDLSGVDTVSVSLQVLDESGRALEIQAVPLPPALLLFISGIASLIGLAGTGAGIGRFNSRKPDPVDSL